MCTAISIPFVSQAIAQDGEEDEDVDEEDGDEEEDGDDEVDVSQYSKSIWLCSRYMRFTRIFRCKSFSAVCLWM